MRNRAWAAVALLVAACGLFSSDLASFKFRLPRKDFRIDTADWGIAGGGTVPSVPCSADCAAARSQLCGSSSCSTSCDSATSTCQLAIGLTLRNDVDLAKEAPELQKVADQSVISVTIEDVYFDIGENTLTIATPTLYVYFAPADVADAADPRAELIGILDPIPPRTTGRVAMRIEGNGQQVTKKYMDDFRTPFRALVSGQLVVHSGDPVPAGRLVGAVQVEARAGL